MAKEVRTFIIDMEISGEGSHEPGGTPPVYGEDELLKVLEAGCGIHGCTVAEIQSNTLLRRSYSEILFEVKE